MELTGQVAFLTGAGRGIGAAMARAFHRAGTRVVLMARSASEIECVASEIESQGGTALALPGDVSDLKAVERSVGAVIKRFDQIDILVNCAGVLGPVGPLPDNDPQAWVETIQVNLVGTMYCLRAVLPHMIRRRRGVVINLSGGGSVSPFPRFSAYGASKAAVVRLTETIAEEVMEYGIRANAISPGVVNTRLLDQTLATGDAAGAAYHSKIMDFKSQGGIPPERAARVGGVSGVAASGWDYGQADQRSLG